MTCPNCATWRARAEALAGALEELETGDFAPPYVLVGIRRALASLPAQALAERRALERCAKALRELDAGGWVTALHVTAHIERVLADLDAAQQPQQWCHADTDGDCLWSECPQVRDSEPLRTGRHCPLDAVRGEGGA